MYREMIEKKKDEIYDIIENMERDAALNPSLFFKLYMDEKGKLFVYDDVNDDTCPMWVWEGHGKLLYSCDCQNYDWFSDGILGDFQTADILTDFGLSDEEKQKILHFFEKKCDDINDANDINENVSKGELEKFMRLELNELWESFLHDYVQWTLYDAGEDIIDSILENL